MDRKEERLSAAKDHGYEYAPESTHLARVSGQLLVVKD